MKTCHKVLFLLVLVLTSTVLGDWSITDQQWYAVSIDGVKSGWAQEVVETKDARIKTSTVQFMTLSRGGMELSIKVTSEFVETEDGEPVSVSTSQEAMGQVQTSEWLFKDGEIQMTSEAGGMPIIKRVPTPKEIWLTPQEKKELFIQKMKEGAATITYQTMTPELGPSIVTVVMTKMSDETKNVLGKPMVVTAWETVNDKMPVIGTEFYTSDGLHVGSSMNAGFGAITNTIARRDEALAPVVEVPELMVSLFVEPNKKIDSAESILRMRLTSKDNSKVILPSTGYQVATQNDDGSATLVVDLNKPVEATAVELETDYLESSAICDSTDVQVRQIAQDAIMHLPEDSAQFEIALALRKKVYEHITEKNMSKAFGSASQTARSQEGDCTEHGVLLCALLRASNIPSRGVMGMVYVPTMGGKNGVFGWHMWSQALINGKWMDLDATLDVPYTVGHIATMTTRLSDDEMAVEMAGIMNSIGNLEVEVID